MSEFSTIVLCPRRRRSESLVGGPDLLSQLTKGGDTRHIIIAVVVRRSDRVFLAVCQPEPAFFPLTDIVDAAEIESEIVFLIELVGP